MPSSSRVPLACHENLYCEGDENREPAHQCEQNQLSGTHDCDHTEFDMTSATIPKSLLMLGGNSDIAVATAKVLAERGTSKVVLAGRTPAALEAAGADLRSSGLQVATVAFDASDTSDHASFFQTVSTEHGPFDGVLIAFGVLGDEFTIDADPATIDELIDVNFTGAASATLGATQMLAASGGGTVSVISSVTAVRPRRANLAYGAAKAGLDAFCTALRDALTPTPVDVMIVRPGFVHTKMTDGVEPAPFATTADKVGTDIADGFQKQSAEVWSPPILRIVAPVLRNLPGPLWRKISAR